MAVKIHLPETVLRVSVALREEQVVLRRCINMWDTHVVAINIHWPIETFKLDLPINLRKGFRRDGVGEIIIEIKCPAGAKQDDDDEKPKPQTFQDIFCLSHDSSDEDRCLICSSRHR